MKISGFVLDESEAFDRVVDWAKKGWISRAYLQAEYWPHAEKNKAAFPKWKAVLNPLGVGVYATVAGYDWESLPNRIAAINVQCAPNGWCGNFESLMTMEGVNCANIMAAFQGKPTVISYNLLAEQGAFDFRRWSQFGAEVHGQAYDPDGDSTKGPSPFQHVISAFTPSICWGGGGGPAWWYRVLAYGKWSWRWIESYDESKNRLTMRTNSLLAGKVYARGTFTGGHLEFDQSRLVENKNGLIIGKVYGFSPYHKIGYSLGTTRPISASFLKELAQTAHPLNMPVIKKVDLYCFENSREEQVQALVSVA